MIIASLLVSLRLYAADSLKDRRSVVQSVKRRLRNRFNVAVSELGGGEDLRSARLCVVSVSGDRAAAVREVENAANFLDGDVRFEVVERELESF